MKHCVFVSYYHNEDEPYRTEFERQFGRSYITKSVQRGQIDTDVSDLYIKRLIRENYINDASVLVVLVGPNTRGRKHVDWEIYAGIAKASGRTALIGILLPEFPLVENKYKYSDLPGRLADNIQSGYSQVYTWQSIISDHAYMSGVIDTAFERRLTHSDTADNSRPQVQRNTTGQ